MDQMKRGETLHPVRQLPQSEPSEVKEIDVCLIIACIKSFFCVCTFCVLIFFFFFFSSCVIFFFFFFFVLAVSHSL